MKTLYMETTSVPLERTVAEICSCLVQAGANQINQEFAERRVVGLRWTMALNGRTVPFLMPARIDPVFRHLSRKYPRKPHDVVQEQAERVAWRQLLRWIQAQVALIEVGMVEPTEPFAPYIEVRSGVTMFKAIADGSLPKLLGAVTDEVQ